VCLLPELGTLPQTVQRLVARVRDSGGKARVPEADLERFDKWLASISGRRNEPRTCRSGHTTAAAGRRQPLTGGDETDMWKDVLIGLGAAVLLSWRALVVALLLVRPKATCSAKRCGSCPT
jgi:hypothetical protein